MAVATNNAMSSGSVGLVIVPSPSFMSDAGTAGALQRDRTAAPQGERAPHRAALWGVAHG
jgi:hypothetical protein